MMRFNWLLKEMLLKKYKELYRSKDVIWLEVPMSCVTRKAKDDIIIATIETLEHKINILNH